MIVTGPSVMRRLTFLIALAFAAVPAGPAVAALHVPFRPASPGNYSHAVRSASAIRLVVVHATESTFASTVAWFQNPRARVSAHYVVGRDGSIAQMVPLSHAAWHAGNAYVNLHSIGIEHEGFTAIDTTFTDVQYRASAALVASLLRHYVLPIDRRHVIGHSEVPDPIHPGLFGGSSHHTDPGHFWDWKRYMAYVRSYARGATPPPLPFDVTTDGVPFEGTVRGTVPWAAVPTGEDVDHIDFLVDGKLRDTERTAPYAYAGGSWDTTRETNGSHVLTVRAFARDGSHATSATIVVVANPPIGIRAVSVTTGQTLTGQVRVEATVRGTPIRVEFLLDGVVRDVQAAPPYVFGGATGTWDTTQETNGPHFLTVRAIGPTGKPAATKTISVVVANP